MIWDLKAPCATCPYRREVKRALWAEEEFTNLLTQNSDPMTGHMFGCHSYGKEPPEQHRPCVGWLLDQKRNNTPSIQLRMTLITKPEAAALYNEISDEGLDLYGDVQEMYEANYPRRRRRRSR